MARRSMLRAAGVLGLVAATVPGVAGAQNALVAAMGEAPPSLASRNGAVMATLTRIARRMRRTNYEHRPRVDERAGFYEFDCSGLATWVLYRAAPRAWRAIVRRTHLARPLARDYYLHFTAAPDAGADNDWQRVPRVADAQPGDLVAWLRPETVESRNTGHVAFVIDAPRPWDEFPEGYLVRVADASSSRHENDTRTGTGMTGFGAGTLLLVAGSETGAPVAYGWWGRKSVTIHDAEIAIGRPVR